MTGERWCWFELADRQHRSLQECLESNTSTEFVDWMYYIQEKVRREAVQVSKQDYYSAQLAAEIHNFRQMVGCWTKNPKLVTTEDMLLKFKSSEQPATVSTDSVPPPQTIETLPPKKPDIDMDDPESVREAMKNPYWQKVNSNAKTVWAQRFGMSSITEAVGGSKKT
jgi:hypothetical protein